MGMVLDQLSGKAFVALGGGGGGAFGVVGASLYQKYAQPHTCPTREILCRQVWTFWGIPFTSAAEAGTFFGVAIALIVLAAWLFSHL
jgi:hypothetical protein